MPHFHPIGHCVVYGLCAVFLSCDDPERQFSSIEVLPGTQQGDYRNHCLGDQRGAVKKRETWRLRSEMPDELVYDSGVSNDSVWCVCNYVFDDAGLRNIKTTVHCNSEQNQQRIIQEMRDHLNAQFGDSRKQDQWKTLSCIGEEEIITVSDTSLGKAHHTISLLISGTR
ncbi:MAG: hypothetical protein ACKO66_09500 [Flavobacteriales bacterium]